MRGLGVEILVADVEPQTATAGAGGPRVPGRTGSDLFDGGSLGGDGGAGVPSRDSDLPAGSVPLPGYFARAFGRFHRLDLVGVGDEPIRPWDKTTRF